MIRLLLFIFCLSCPFRLQAQAKSGLKATDTIETAENTEKSPEIKPTSKDEKQGSKNHEKKVTPLESLETRTAENVSFLGFRRARINTFFRYQFFTLGADFEAANNELTGLFGGEQLRTYDKDFSNTFSMVSGDAVSPSLRKHQFGLGFSITVDDTVKHQFEYGVLLLGQIPLTTVDLKTTMVLKENCSVAPCRLSDTTFVDSTTRQGLYDLNVATSEDLLIVAPSVSYDYQLTSFTWGSLSAGASFALMVASYRQVIQFSSVRIDDTSNTTLKAIEGEIVRTALAKLGPLFGIHMTYVFRAFGNTGGRIRLGGTYGLVPMTVETSGDLTNVIGSTRVSKNPISQLGFGATAKRTLNALGFFMEVGLSF